MGNSTAETTTVIHPARTCMRLQRGGTGLELNRRGCGTGGTGPMILWLTGWTAGCVLLAHEVLNKKQMFLLVFAIPFWASWFAVAGYIAYALFGFERLTLGRSGATIAKGIGPWTTSQRHIPLAELRRAELHKSSYEVNDQPVFGVQIRTAGHPIKVTVGVEDDEREWLIATINRELDTLGVVNVTSETQAGSAVDRFTTTIQSSSSKPPSDSAWEMSPTVAGMDFVRRGKFRLGTFAGLTFINLFWNGIVAVFVLSLLGIGPGKAPSGGHWWFLFFFLIPFEVIGLIMLGAWVACLTTPAWRDVLSLDRYEIGFRFSVLGIGRTRRLPTAELSGLNVRRQSRKKSSHSLREGGEWEITLADRTNREALRLKHLTEGEANWIAATLRRMYPRTFNDSVV